MKLKLTPKLKRDPNCTDCGLCKTAEFVCLLGQGPRPCDIMIIGEAPGEREDDSGKPFVGRSGKLLEDLLWEYGKLKREDVYITNAVHCRPPDNRTPKRKEIEACKRWLQAEIKAVKPKYILTLGNIPLQSLFGIKGIRKHRGMPIEKDGIIYFPTYHPAYALRDERQKPVLAADIKMFTKIVAKGGIAKEEGLNYHIISSWKDVEQALEDIRKNDVLSIDTETTGLYQWDPGFDIVSLGIGTRKHQWCFPLSHDEGWLKDKPNLRRVLIKRIDKAIWRKALVMQNGKFDTLGMAVIYGVWWYVDFDVMLAHYNLDENSPHDLGFLAQHFFDAIDYDIPLEEKHGHGPIKRHCRYLSLDAYYTRRLYYKFKKMLEEDQATKAIFECITMPVARMYADIEFLGPYINRKQLEKARLKYQAQSDEAREDLDELVPDKRQWKNKKAGRIETGVNWGSPDQVADVLFNKLEMKPLDKTKGGKSSVNESVLLRLAKKSGSGAKVAKTILTWREAKKNLEFLDSWDKLAIKNRLHPSFKIHGTVTGRPSCENPNLQQVPRNPILRSVITAPENYTLVDADQSQVEMRIGTELSQDPVLKQIYQTGGDVHTKTCQEIMGIMKPTKEERKKAKAINFGFLFGMWWKKFILYARDNYDLEFTPREAQEVRTGYFRLYAGLAPWQNKQRRFANTHGYVRNLFGRKRRLPAAMRRDDSLECREAERQAINSPVQSMAVDITQAGALALHGDRINRPEHPKAIKPRFSRDIFRLTGTIHDANLGECRNDKLRIVVPEIKKIMSWPPLMDVFGVRMSVPLVAEAELGPWGAPISEEKLLQSKSAA